MAMVMFLRNKLTSLHFHLAMTDVTVTDRMRRLASKLICGNAGDLADFSYTYSQITKITKNFSRVHGRGEFGEVYHGVLNNQQVAVEMFNEASINNIEMFTAEVQDFVNLRHKNLVQLIGYCVDGDHLALIHEFVANGNLKDHLSDKLGNVLSWKSRLEIIIGAAEGLEYLHSKLGLHRYIKPTNILLDENFNAKLADFGLSRSSPTDPNTKASNKIYVNPGRDPYIDHQFFTSNCITQESDTYSFGVVLLEIITNQPVIDSNREYPHLSGWAKARARDGHTLEIVDPRLNSEFEPNSVRKAISIALSCVRRIRGFSRGSNDPHMSQVVIELNECLALEMSRTHARTGQVTRGSQ